VTKQPALLRVLAHNLTSKAVQENHTLRNSGYSIYCTALLFFFSLLLDPGSLRPRCLKKLKPIGLVMSRLLPLSLARAMPPSREVTPSGMGRRLAKAIFALPSLSPILSSARAPARLFPRSATPLPFPGNGPPSIPQISSDFDSFPPDTPPIQQRTAHNYACLQGEVVFLFPPKRLKKDGKCAMTRPTYTATCGQLRV